jgi:hypothetical protein
VIVALVFLVAGLVLVARWREGVVQRERASAAPAYPADAARVEVRPAAAALPQAVAIPAPAAAGGFPRPSAARDHVKILAWIYILWGVVSTAGLALTMIGWCIVTAIDGAASFPRPVMARDVIVVIAAALLVIAIACCFPATWIFIGRGLLRRRGWARYMAVAFGVVKLPFFPVGTLAGAYALWVLFDERIAAGFKAREG